MLKFAVTTTSMRFDDRIVRIAEGDAWHATDPFVLAHPELFADQPVYVFGVAAKPAPVESASAAPGERRTVKRAN